MDAPSKHPTTEGLTEESLIGRVQSMRAWRSGGVRAPHKPLLLLYALGRASRGIVGPVRYEHLAERLGALLRDYGVPGRTPRPEYPFWHLQNDHLWTIEGEGDLRSTDSPSGARLRQAGARGSLPQSVVSLLVLRPELINRLAGEVLNRAFPESLHGEIRDAVELVEIDPAAPPVFLGAALADHASLAIARGPRVPTRGDPEASEPPVAPPAPGTRDPAFRRHVLEAYGHSCAVCGLALSMGHTPLGLDAAHIRWHQAGGPATVDNGLSLCVLHHRLLDRGAFTVDSEMRLVLSSELQGGSGFETHMGQYHGLRIRVPARSTHQPSLTHLAWHGVQVFHGPGLALP